jgi:SAM-dependent methyltransferase
VTCDQLPSRYDPNQVPRGNRRLLLDRVSRDGPALDVGCWSGFAGRYVATHHGVVTDGVEPDAAMAATAGKIYRQVIQAPIEDALPRLVVERRHRYATILFLDVLEHLVDPARVLRDVHPLLAPEGRLLVSIPNVAHWSVRRELAMGRWAYTSSGLLDETHLRFFTISTARRLLERAGWTVTWHEVDIDEPRALRRLPVARRRSPAWQRLFGVQALFEVRAVGQPSSSR